jgi:cyclohexa-1,5-dienecarbonyl-CoA hydratase
MAGEKVRLTFQHERQVARLTLAAPKANILDRAMMAALLAELKKLHDEQSLKAVVLDAEGDHFSFGASIEEHLPTNIGRTLVDLRELLYAVTQVPAPVIAAVRGQCLGGAFELVLACDLVIADESAQFGLPEIKLGVFPPAGAALLPIRIGAGRASDFVLTGASWTAERALPIGLIHRCAPRGVLEQELQEWLASDFLPRSAAGLRFAAQAARRPVVRAIKHELPGLEELYLYELMRHPDGVEGVQAFLEKRQPRWAKVGAKLAG